MIIAAAYYFKGSQNTFWTYKNELAEVGEITRSVDSDQYKTKQSQKKNNAWYNALQSCLLERCLQRGFHPQEMGNKKSIL